MSFSVRPFVFELGASTGRTDRQTDRQKDGQTDGQTDGRAKPVMRAVRSASARQKSEKSVRRVHVNK